MLEFISEREPTSTVSESATDQLYEAAKVHFTGHMYEEALGEFELCATMLEVPAQTLDNWRNLKYYIQQCTMRLKSEEIQEAAAVQREKRLLTPIPVPPLIPVVDSRHEFFVTFRFVEAETEANLIKEGLEARGHKTFVSNETPGSDLQEAIAKAIGESKVQIMLATKTYGKKTNQQYSTYQEMNYSLDHNPFLIKMPADVEWEESATQMALSGRMWEAWTPGEPIPEGLIDRIIAKAGTGMHI